MKQRWIWMVVAATCMAGCNGGESQQARTMAKPQSAASSSAPGHVWHMKKAEIKQMIGYDAMPMWGIPAVPQRQVTALTMLIPTDWQFQSGVKSSGAQDCNFTVGRAMIVTNSPDKKVGLVSIPADVTVWTNDNVVGQTIQQDNQRFAKIQNCKMEQPRPLAQKIGSIASGINKNFQAAGPMQPIPGMADKLQSAVNQANQQLAQQGVQLTVEGGRIPLRSSSDEGDGYLTVVQIVRAQRLPSGGTVWTTDYPMQVITFAPTGKYAEYDSMFATMLESIWINPEYSQACQQVSANIQSIKLQTKQRLNQIANQMAMDNANAARQQAAIRQGAQNYSNQVHASVAANRSAALEHSSQQFALYMGDQQQYHDPNGGIVQLPSGSTHAWASSTGNTNEYILSDSPSFNPNGNVGSASWTQMQPVR